MVEFPDGLYADVRTEEVLETSLEVADGERLEDRERRYRAAFVRVFDGRRWYYESTSEVERLQEVVDRLAAMARPDPAVAENPVVRRFEVHQGHHRHFEGRELDRVGRPAKREALAEYQELLAGCEQARSWRAGYSDRREVRRFVSSLGADLDWDTQRCGAVLRVELAEGERTHAEHCSLGGDGFEDARGRSREAGEWLATAVEFLRHADPVRPGRTTVVLHPYTTGVFAHECFGHKSEADFMVGDPEALAEWSIGRKIGADCLSIVVDGGSPGMGFVPFDDEGTRGRRVPLIEDGRLAGRLHSEATAAALGEEPTGNGRAVDYRFEPIPRQTNTYVEPGTLSREELFEGVEDGVYVENFRHGSGMSTFTIAPCRAYRIVDGKVADPVKVSVVTGQVFEALAKVDGCSDTLEILHSVGGGCGKMEQMGLPVALGGPYMRVRDMEVG